MKKDRFVITDRMWELMEPHCLGKPTDPGRTGGDCRLFMEGFCGLRARIVLGGIYQNTLVSGTRYSNGFVNGLTAMYSIVCSIP